MSDINSRSDSRELNRRISDGVRKRLAKQISTLVKTARAETQMSLTQALRGSGSDTSRRSWLSKVENGKIVPELVPLATYLEGIGIRLELRIIDLWNPSNVDENGEPLPGLTEGHTPKQWLKEDD